MEGCFLSSLWKRQARGSTVRMTACLGVLVAVVPCDFASTFDSIGWVQAWAIGDQTARYERGVQAAR